MSNTPILGLRQYGSLDDFDYTEINTQNQQLDRLPPTVCTSATRPVDNLFQGRYIWESDTLKLLMYDLSTLTWKEIQDATDTGWVTCNPTAGWTQAAGATLQARQLGQYVSIRGGVVNAGFSGGYTTAANLPAAIDPPGSPLAIPVNANANVSRSVNVNPDRTISVYASAASGSAYYLGGGYLL